MKRIATLLSFFALVLCLTACNREDPIPTVTVNVNVTYPATYNQPNAAGVRVTLTNTADASSTTAVTDGSGRATFADVLPGNYNVAASRSLTEAEALALTGISQRVELNAARNAVAILETPNPLAIDLRLSGSTLGSLVIKEVYYTGSRTPANGTYFSDQFVEIYNNSTDTLFLDGLCIADAYGVSGLINPTNRPTEFSSGTATQGIFQQNVFVNSVWRIPGTGRQRPLAPGRSIVIAQDGVNHRAADLNPSSPVDLSGADWETFNERPDGRDADAPGVPNLERLYFTGGFDWLLPVFGPGLIIFRTDNVDALERIAIPGAAATVQPRIRVPGNLVIDAFEALQNGNSRDFKRIPTALDAGFVFADDTYNRQSFRRKTATTIGGRRVLQDSNNSTNDFEKIASPTPKGF
ncbi:DUF4876 domain-containing protein [Spirosoma montaniterrae]|uniref:LTD domain-containing protein n=1 Tax=Spirosoma montaniterrae TaxID=1178516 RepID=A0A1P9WR90_9BACT|nr:DUF4876 domain-containing protein [Spirosoma montaniterrae]AQG77887.1 hypothetical protein AWR27_00065 [Spirosoma montaniterrae]